MSGRAPSGQALAVPVEPVARLDPTGFDPSRSVRFSRAWAMPSPDTFSVAPIGAFVRRYLAGSSASIDPFARNNRWATATNDINPDTTAEYHLDAEQFCREMGRMGQTFDLAIFDPPYSPRQISECYRGIGLNVGTKETQNAALYRRVRDALLPILTADSIVLSFGWNSCGMGLKRGFRLAEILLVANGGAHNDTICIAEQRTASAIEARRAATAETGAVHESAVGEAETPNPPIAKAQGHD